MFGGPCDVDIYKLTDSAQSIYEKSICTLSLMGSPQDSRYEVSTGISSGGIDSCLIRWSRQESLQGSRHGSRHRVSSTGVSSEGFVDRGRQGIVSRRRVKISPRRRVKGRQVANELDSNATAPDTLSVTQYK